MLEKFETQSVAGSGGLSPKLRFRAAALESKLQHKMHMSANLVNKNEDYSTASACLIIFPSEQRVWALTAFADPGTLDSAAEIKKDSRRHLHPHPPPPLPEMPEPGALPCL